MRTNGDGPANAPDGGGKPAASAAMGRRDVLRLARARSFSSPRWAPATGTRPGTRGEGRFLVDRAPAPVPNLAGLVTEGKTAAEIDAAAPGAQTGELQGTIQTFSHFENLPGGGRRPLRAFPHLIQTPRAAYAARGMGRNPGEGVLSPRGDTMARGARAAYPQRGDHARCTTRMSDSPAGGAADPAFRVHGRENVDILSKAVFPPGGAANPTPMLAALGFCLLDPFVGLPSRTARPGRHGSSGSGPRAAPSFHVHAIDRLC